MDGDAAVTFRDVSLAYEGRTALEAVEGRIRRGELLALVGPNGAGKSTLLKAVVGELAPVSGRIDLHGVAPSAMAYLPQSAEIDRTFPVTVSAFATMGLWHTLGAFRRGGARERALVADALAKVGLGMLGSRTLGALSGGQFQRLLFARTILQDARTILLDEPFTSVDAHTTADLLAIVLEWHREGRTVVAALHDLAQVRSHFPRCLLLAGRPVAWGDTAAVLAPDQLDRARGPGDHPSASLCRHGPHEAHVGAGA